jgi:chemotaxis regulatin CheY-phosphate phosphatase CheZ
MNKKSVDQEKALNGVVLEATKAAKAAFKSLNKCRRKVAASQKDFQSYMAAWNVWLVAKAKEAKEAKELAAEANLETDSRLLRGK